MKNYMVRQFTCMSKADYNEVVKPYKTYVAELFKNGDIVVNEKKLMLMNSMSCTQQIYINTIYSI